jgi:hypothetical protein
MDMQKDVIFHPERLAILALPIAGDKSNYGSEASTSSESHHAQRRGRRISITQDFGSTKDRQSFTEITSPADHLASLYFQRLTTEALRDNPASCQAKDQLTDGHWLEQATSYKMDAASKLRDKPTHSDISDVTNSKYGVSMAAPI